MPFGPRRWGRPLRGGPRFCVRCIVESFVGDRRQLAGSVGGIGLEAAMPQCLGLGSAVGLVGHVVG